ncbi:MAG: DUF6382 domain-containing protein [Deltaproteobacteria bacterium]
MQITANERTAKAYEKDMQGSCIVLKLADNEKVIDYQVKMIQSNPSAFFVPFAVRRKNDKTSIAYETASRDSVSRFLENTRIERQEVVQILKNLLRALSEGANYLLDKKNYIINGNYIFITPDSLEISLIYVPINLNEDLHENIKRFALYLIDNMTEEGRAHDAFIETIMTYLKTNDFNLEDFNFILEGIQKQKGFKDKRFNGIGIEEDFKISIPDIGLAEKQQNAESSVKNDSEKMNININKKKYDKFRILALGGILQILIILSIVLAYQFLGSNDLNVFFGIILIAFSAEIFAIRYIVSKKKIGLRNILNFDNSEGIK